MSRPGGAGGAPGGPLQEGRGEGGRRSTATQQAPSQEELVSRLQEQVRVLNEQVSCLSAEKKQLKQQNGEKEEEISRLKQALQTDDEKSGTWFPWCGGTNPPVKVFHVQISIAGKTGGWERQLLKYIRKLLSRQGVSLRVTEFRETSKDPLLVFCPIASSMAMDTKNALEGLSGKQKVLLVVMHYMQKDNTKTPGKPKKQVSHPALLQTVHTRYTLQDGFYPCEMNATAVADVADAIKDLAWDH